MEVLDRAQVTDHTAPHLGVVAAFGAGIDLAVQVAVLGADREGGRQRDVRELVVGERLADERFGDLDVADLLAEIEVEHRAARVLALQLVLEVERLEDVVGEADRQLGRVGVVGGVLPGGDDIGIFFPVELGEAVAGALRRSRLEVVDVARLLLEAGDRVAHEVEDVKGEFLPLGSGDVLAHEVEAGLVHADEADRVEVVEPVAAGALLHVFEVVRRIGVHAAAGLLLDRLALDLEALLGDLHQVEQAGFELLLRPGEIADAREVDRHDADRAGERVGAEETAAALSELARVEPQAACSLAPADGERI